LTLILRKQNGNLCRYSITKHIMLQKKQKNQDKTAPMGFALSIGFVYFFRVAPIYIRYIPQKENKTYKFYHCSCDRIVAASLPLQMYTESANPIGAVLSWFFCFVFLLWYIPDVNWCNSKKVDEAYISLIHI
jgi:hypothetical protein